MTNDTHMSCFKTTVFIFRFVLYYNELIIWSLKLNFDHPVYDLWLNWTQILLDYILHWCGLPILRFWEHPMKVNPETRRAHLNRVSYLTILKYTRVYIHVPLCTYQSIVIYSLVHHTIFYVSVSPGIVNYKQRCVI